MPRGFALRGKRLSPMMFVRSFAATSGGPWMALSGQVRTRATTGTTGIAGSGLSDAAALRGQMGKGGRGGGGVKVTSRTEGWEGKGPQWLHLAAPPGGSGDPGAGLGVGP